MTSASPDCIVVTLVEIQGGPAKWERVEQHFREVEWSFRTPSPKERRTARRAFDSNPAKSRSLWADIPVVGSPWRAVREAPWSVADVRRATRVVVYDRMLQPEESDRTIQPEWQVHATRAQTWSTAPPHAPRWSKPVWWLRRALYGSAVRTGLFDIGVRVHGDRSARPGRTWRLRCRTRRGLVGRWPRCRLVGRDARLPVVEPQLLCARGPFRNAVTEISRAIPAATAAA